jgi:hypothetical protein
VADLFWMDPSAGNWMPPPTIFTAVPAACPCDEKKIIATKQANSVISLDFMITPFIGLLIQSYKQTLFVNQ